MGRVWFGNWWDCGRRVCGWEMVLAWNCCTPAPAALGWLCGLGFGRHVRECVVFTFVIFYLVGF